MNCKFKETLLNKNRFSTYGLATITAIRCTRVIAEYGGDLEAISLFLEGIDKLQSQLLNALPIIKQEEIKDEVENLLKDLGIK